MPKNNPRIHLQQQNKKIHADDNYLFQSFCSRKVAETIAVLRLPSNSISGKSWSSTKVFVMQDYTENTNGDVP